MQGKRKYYLNYFNYGLKCISTFIFLVVESWIINSFGAILGHLINCVLKHKSH